MALDAAFAPALQTLIEAERRDLLGVGSSRESFVRDFMALLELHPDSLPAALRPTETPCDWKTRETLAAQRWAIALAGYQLMIRGGAPAGRRHPSSCCAAASAPLAGAIEADTTAKPTAAAKVPAASAELPTRLDFVGPTRSAPASAFSIQLVALRAEACGRPGTFWSAVASVSATPLWIQCRGLAKKAVSR